MGVMGAIGIGALCGLLSGLPYLVVFVLMKKRHAVSIFPAVVAVCVSIGVVALSLLATYAFMRDMLVVSMLALVVMLLVTVSVSAAVFARRPRS